MEKGTSVIKSPDLINLNDTDTDAEIQYKSLGAMNGNAAVDTDELQPSVDSPVPSSPASDSPKPARTNHVQWQTTLLEERRQLLATEGESSDRHSSEDEVDVWTVSAEQRHYYVQQFLALQPELAGLVPGQIAKAFFEKSKLPVVALSKIWNLADVTRDGCLCLEEFITAMHLVVLRRNRIDVPDHLPPSLVPKVNGTPVQRPADPTVSSTANSAASLTSPKGKEWTKFVESPMSNISSPGIKPANFDFHKSAVEENPQILHPVAVKGTREEQDRLHDTDSDQSASPEPAPPVVQPASAAAVATVAAVAAQHTPRQLKHSCSVPPGSGDSGPSSLPVLGQTAPALPCRLPQPAPQPALQPAPPPPPPPPPPPRPTHSSHARSSSLDLSRVPPHQPPQQPPPLVPPRSSPADATRGHGRPSQPAVDLVDTAGFADFSRFHEPAPEASRHRQGAFEVYKKPAVSEESSADARYELGEPGAATDACRDTGDGRCATAAALAVSPARLANMSIQDMIGMGSWSRDTLQLMIRAQRERTAMLCQVTTELNQELADAMEERTWLELQLDHMRPNSD